MKKTSILSLVLVLTLCSVLGSCTANGDDETVTSTPPTIDNETIVNVQNEPTDNTNCWAKVLVCVDRDNADYKYGYIDQSGSFVIAPNFDEIGDFSEDGWAKVRIDVNDPLKGYYDYGLYGYIDRTGAYMIEPLYSEIGDFAKNDLAMVRFDGKAGYIDRTGTLVVEPKFDWAGDFTDDGWAIVRINEKYGYIDQTGNYVIDPQFDYANVFSSNGVALVGVYHSYKQSNGIFPSDLCNHTIIRLRKYHCFAYMSDILRLMPLHYLKKR